MVMAEVTLSPGWLARDMKRATDRVEQWKGSTMNAAEKLAREISRVTEVIGHYEETIAMAKRGELKQLSPLTEAVVLPMLRGQLESAMKAAGSNDALEVIKALAILEGIN